MVDATEPKAAKNYIVSDIDTYFRSSNGVPVERATIRAHEWKLVKDYIGLLESACEMYEKEKNRG